ncbi:purine and uridine phosphorylase [Xylaria sp. FL0043]|nr:purine and uridine phosphorylase [Xylaria sp. FL0043]
MSPPSSSEYAVGWLCTSPVELSAASVVLDESCHKPEIRHTDPDQYLCGRIGHYKVVVLLLSAASSPRGYRTTPTTQCSEQAIKCMLQDFPNIRIWLAVGVGDGVPTQKSDIQLGDVVVGVARGTNKGVFTYDVPKTLQNGRFESIEVFDPPPSILASYMVNLEGYCHLPDQILKNKLWQRPQISEQLCQNDIVNPKAEQPSSIACEQDISQLVQRRKREGHEDAIRVHYGTIASSSERMEDASILNALATTEDVLCFETEAYGILKEVSCLVIRGISHYADSHSNNNAEWERFAAFSASLYAAKLLHLLPSGLFDLQIVQKPKRFFRVGRCFVTQWVEPRSSRLGTQSHTHAAFSTKSNDGVFTEMRRFLVVNERFRSAWCVPIHTYQGRGTTKPDIRLCDHAKIFPYGDADPEWEFPLRQPIAIFIEGESDLHRLHPASLANFGKIYTIEHDVPVMNIGYVPQSYIKHLKLDLTSLEMTTLNEKYQKLRRDQGLFNIKLRGKENLDIQELDLGAEGSVNITISGESKGRIQKLRGIKGSLNVTVTGQGTLELGTVAVNGTINITLSGESQVTVKELQEYGGNLVGTNTDKARLTMEHVELMDGSISLALSSKSQSIFETLQGHNGSFLAKADDEAELRILKHAKLVTSLTNVSFIGRSQLFVNSFRSDAGSFITKAGTRANLNIDEAEFYETAVSVSTNSESSTSIGDLRNIGGSFTAKTDVQASLRIRSGLFENSSVNIDSLQKPETKLIQQITEFGELNVKVSRVSVPE